MRRFFLVILGILLASNIGAGVALTSVLAQLDAGPTLRWIMGAFLAVQGIGLVMTFGARALGYQPGAGLGRPLLSLVLIWNLLLALPTAVLAAIGAVLLRVFFPAAGVQLAPDVRVALIVAAFFPVTLALLATAVSIRQLVTFRVQHLKLTLPNLPTALKGLSIVHLSDLHVGKLTRGRVLDDMVTTANRLDADLVLVTGDIINMALEDLPRAAQVLSAIKSRHGLFLCEGNHDLIEDAAGFERAIRATGLCLLLNESARVSIRDQAVQIIGLRWGEGQPEAGDESSVLAQLMKQGGRDDFRILLVHHPEAFDAAAAVGIPLTLAGHTHGGQLMLSPTVGFGPRLYRYWSGWYQKGASQLVVSNGAGNWFPLRINAPAEIIHITLN